ncbi:transglutaminase family protein [Marmoricola sp. RAF53]|uniref:transglutaminase family protein n=1 Tax=Marmoricola sp. RAF53 TaxID=3233059 RepID=UPI003F966995
MKGRFTALAGVAAIAGLMAWVALQSWRGLVEEPNSFLGPALTGTILVVLVGALGRTARFPFYAVLALQVLVLLVWLEHRITPGTGLAGWVPSATGVQRLGDAVARGAADINTFASPVSTEHPDAAFYLLATGMLVVLSVDLLACGLRRAPWAGLPIVITLTVPISVLEEPLSWLVFLVVAMLFALLLSTQQIERVRAWEHAPGAAERHDSVLRPAEGTSLRAGALRIGLATAAGALVLPILVPVTGGMFGSGKGGNGSGGEDQTVTLVNPLVDLHRDLVDQNHIPLLTATTDDPDTSYLRTTVLDQFDGRRWKPSQRDMPADNKVDGALPHPPGLPSLIGNSSEWSLRFEPRFHSSWLPAPFPLRSMRVSEGDWRYDGRTMDFANVDKRTPAGITYDLVAVHPSIDSVQLDNAVAAPSAVRTPMIALPDNLPPVVEDIARQVTADGRSAYEKAVLLQNWFRSSGGFTYSLEPGVDPGSSMDALVAFITTDKIGYCEQYAAAMAIMARSLGIPARVAVGFLSPDDNGDGTYTYTSDALHAWPEIYFSGSGWVRFEPTPSARTGAPPSWTQERATNAPSARPSAAATSANQRPDSELAQRSDAVSAQDSSVTTPLAWIALGILALAAATVPALVRRRQRRLRLEPAGTLDSDRVAAGLWNELLATAEDLRVPLPAERSVRDVAVALSERIGPGPDDGAALAELVAFLERARFGRTYEVESTSLHTMTRVVRTWCRLLAEDASRSRRAAARVLPRSIFTRRGTAELAPVTRAESETVGAGEIS